MGTQKIARRSSTLIQTSLRDFDTCSRSPIGKRSRLKLRPIKKAVSKFETAFYYKLYSSKTTNE
jgi:hypothetical protein